MKRGRAKRILVVDDDGETAAALSGLFQLEGFEVDVAVDGQRAVQASLTNRPDVVITDLVMPNMGGIDLIKAFKLDRSLAEVPIIAVSAEDERELHNAELVGAVAAYPKPLDFEKCLSIVTDVVEAENQKNPRRMNSPLVSSVSQRRHQSEQGIK